MATAHALPLLDDDTLVRPKAGSAADKVLATQIAPAIEPHFILYQIDSYEAEFIKATKDTVREGRIIRTPITPDNLRQVFDKWVAMVGVELGVKREANYAVLFFADIMHDGRSATLTNLPARLLFNGDTPVFIMGPSNTHWPARAAIAISGTSATARPNKIRQEYQLNRPEAGWYQVRRVLEAYGDTEFTDFGPYKAAYADLSAKLRPQVFELGFLQS